MNHTRFRIGVVMILLGFVITSDAPVLVVIECLLILVGAFVAGGAFFSWWWHFLAERRHGSS